MSAALRYEQPERSTQPLHGVADGASAAEAAADGATKEAYAAPPAMPKIVPIRDVTQDVPASAVESEEADADWFAEAMRKSVQRPIAPQALASRPARATPPVASRVASMAQSAFSAPTPEAAPTRTDASWQGAEAEEPSSTAPRAASRKPFTRRTHRGGAPAIFVLLYAGLATGSAVLLRGQATAGDLADAAGRARWLEAAAALWWSEGQPGPVALGFAAVMLAITACWAVGRWAAGSSFGRAGKSARFSWGDVASALLLGTAAGIPAVLIVGACATGGELRPFVEAVEQVSLAPFLSITWPWWLAAALAYWACQTCAARMVWREHGWRTTALSTLPWATAWAVGTVAGVVSSI